MRLIDADALIAQIEAETNELVDRTEYQFAAYVAIHEVNNAPTIEPERKTGKWIPCSERLPEKQCFCLVSVCAPYKTVRAYEYVPCEGYENENLWKAEDGSYCFNWFVEAWMPLPAPYQKEDEG